MKNVSCDCMTGDWADDMLAVTLLLDLLLDVELPSKLAAQCMAMRNHCHGRTKLLSVNADSRLQ